MSIYQSKYRRITIGSLSMMYPIEPEDDYLCSPLDWDEFYTEETFGDRLKLFYDQFNSSARPLLDRSLFREIEANGAVTELQILCSSEIVYKRLAQKHQKIGNEIRWIWPETITNFSIGFMDESWTGQFFELENY
jgi:hypothetical protein